MKHFSLQSDAPIYLYENILYRVPIQNVEYEELEE